MGNAISPRLDLRPTVEDGTPIDFVLQDPAAAAVAETLATKGATATIQTEGSDIDRGKR